MLRLFLLAGSDAAAVQTAQSWDITWSSRGTRLLAPVPSRTALKLALKLALAALGVPLALPALALPPSAALGSFRFLLAGASAAPPAGAAHAAHGANRNAPPEQHAQSAIARFLRAFRAKSYAPAACRCLRLL